MHYTNGYIHCVNRIFSAIAAIILLLLSNTVFAGKADSLKAVYRNHVHNDTTKVALLAQVAALFKDGNADSMAAYALQGLDLAGKLDFDRGIALCKEQLGIAYTNKQEYEKGLGLLQESLHTFETINDKKGQREDDQAIANVYYRQSKYSEALDYYNRGRQLAEQLNDLKSVGLALASIGSIYLDMGNYAQSLQYYLKGLSVFEQKNSKQGMLMCLTNIATLYSNMGDYKKAIEYINRSLDMQQSTGDRQGMMANLVNIGVVYGQMKDQTHALEMFGKALAIADTIGDEYWQMICTVNMGQAYDALGRYDEALNNYNDVLKKVVKINDQNILMSAHSGIGSILLKKGQNAEGIKHLLIAYDIMKKNGMKQPILEITPDISEAYEKQHDYLHAMEFNKIYHTYKDSVFNENNDKHIQQLQFDYELGKKENQIALLNKDKALEKVQNEKQKAGMWGLAASIALLLVIIALMYRNNIYEKRNQQKILKQKEEIQAQAIKLEELNRYKDNTFSVISHDLRGPLHSFTSAMALLNDNDLSPDEFKTLGPEVSKQLGSLNLLLDNILAWAKNNMQVQIAAKPVRTNLYHLAQENINLLQETADRKHISLRNHIAESTYATCDPGQMNIVLRNIIMNAIKYTRSGGTIILFAGTDNNIVKFSVADDGVGMNQEQLAKLFTPSPQNNTYGTEGEKGIGLGLLLCYEFTKANNGTITVESEPNKGSTFTITLPA